MRSSWVLISLLNFVIASIMGVLLRYVFVAEVPWMDYRNMLHGHSHVAMLGWVYLILFALLIDAFVPPTKRSNPFYNRLFWFTQFTVIGMMASFPIQGYGAVSITFSTLHILASYLFVWRIWKDLNIKNRQVLYIVRASLLFLIISTIGIWAMGPVMALQLRNDPLYMVVVQFYLHFQFNGWFALAVLALLVYQLNQWGLSINQRYFNIFFTVYIFSLTLTFFQVLHWAYLDHYMYVINAVGVMLQVLAFGFLLFPLKEKILKKLAHKSGTIKWLVGFGLVSLIIKVVIQAALVVPEVTEISTTIRQFMVGYIHLTMLGFITGFILLFLYVKEVAVINISGIYIFSTGYIMTEAILFTQGLFFWARWGTLPFYHEILLGFSVLLPLGLIIMAIKPYISEYSQVNNHIKA
ncbi:MAG TPA: hypothetical protein VK921_05960 [Anditalea sp.]|nr:hypothetical protein [Anditalea sp.]